MKLTVVIFLYFRLILEGHDLDKKDDVEFTPKELAKILKKEWLLPLFERKVNGRFSCQNFTDTVAFVRSKEENITRYIKFIRSY